MPSPGGLFDQRSSHMRYMLAVLDVRNKMEKEEIKNMESKNRLEAKVQ